MLKKKKVTLKSVCSEYKRSFGLLFTNFAAVMIICGCFFRLWQTAIMGSFVQDYMGAYGSANQDLFSGIVGIGSLIGGPLTTFISGMLIECFEKKTEMTIPILILLKAFIEIPLNIGSFS